ncbi:MAG: PAC2 family protein [Candidatus Nanopelagicales bacterium]
MIEWDSIPELRRPVLVTSFEGWNDAGDAATDVVDHLRQEWDAELIAELDPDKYYDFQVVRPHIREEGGQRTISWPSTRVYVAHGPDRDFVLVRGIEPNMRWRAFCDEMLSVARDLDVELVINLGALLADVPHTRPVPVSAFSNDPVLLRNTDAEPSNYEGPTGVVGVLQHACDQAGIPALSLWAAVPHYVSQNPCPKAALALLLRMSDVLEFELPVGQLPDDSAAWQSGVEDLSAEDEDIQAYVAQLERARDQENLDLASGDEIAAAFEKYLRGKH